MCVYAFYKWNITLWSDRYELMIVKYIVVYLNSNEPFGSMKRGEFD